MTYSNTKSTKWFEHAQTIFPGGVNSPVRAFKAVGGTPPVFVKGEGPYVEDLDGNRYLDYVGSWGPLIVGHAHPDVLEAVIQTVRKGSSFGAPTPAELELAELIQNAMPSLEMLRFVSSGTEATMSALRLARGCTKRDKIIKFAGCYHGHSDMLLAQAGSGVATLGIPGSPGVPRSVTQNTIVLPYNNLNAIHEAFSQYENEIAAVIVEPVAGNMGMVLPKDEFLPELRKITQAKGALLIFDEVMTGFRVALGGAQEVYNIKPDLTCLGKVIGGGFPCAAFGGKKELMQELAPIGPVYQAGTLSGNPVAMAAGAATLKLIHQPGVFKILTGLTKQLADGIKEAGNKNNINIQINQLGAMCGFFFNESKIENYEDAVKSNSKLYTRFFQKMLRLGHYFAPSQFEAAFVSLVHDSEQIQSTLAAVDEALII